MLVALNTMTAPPPAPLPAVGGGHQELPACKTLSPCIPEPATWQLTTFLFPSPDPRPLPRCWSRRSHRVPSCPPAQDTKEPLTSFPGISGDTKDRAIAARLGTRDTGGTGRAAGGCCWPNVSGEMRMCTGLRPPGHPQVLYVTWSWGVKRFIFDFCRQ